MHLMKRKILITAALPYANGALHFGHMAGAYLPADCYARFEKMRQNAVLFICGSDEYGTAITLSAEKLGRTPKEQASYYHDVNQKLFRNIGIEFDYFSRTTWNGHASLVSQFFIELKQNGFLEERESMQLYSNADQCFLADRYVRGTCPRCQYENARGDECTKCGASYEATELKNPVSSITGTPLQQKKTKHWFMLFDKFSDELLSWLKTKNWKSNVTNFAAEYAKKLHPRAITRDLTWGVPVPGAESKEKVLYVWFDAPIGYISMTKEWAIDQGDPDLWKAYWCEEETKLVQFLGKDNIPFHALFFPAMLMGQNTFYKKVDDLVANEFLLLEGKAFSKSEGWTIDTEAFIQTFSCDMLRYYLASHAPQLQDAEFTFEGFYQTIHSDLVGKLGNLVHRTLTFIQKIGGCIPEESTIQEEDTLFSNQIHLLNKEIDLAYEHYDLRKVTALLMELATLGNVYFDREKPWVLVKSSNSRLSTVLHKLCFCLKSLAIHAYPIIPDASQKLWALLGFTSLLEEGYAQRESSVFTKSPLGSPTLLFKKFEKEALEPFIKALANTEEDVSPVEFEHFNKVDIRIGKILSCEKVKKSKKLLHFTIDIGAETRTILSGIADHYSSYDDLIGKKVAVVTNLHPKKMMGINSHGMLLTSSDDKSVRLVEVPFGDLGSSIC